ncbi:sulfur carrier protein ThiS [Actinospica sp.]|jgi:sulfur carrier protein|uniref:sulfur carrier protein ThiS n=1 Tax=Actinospica sp. TaxID=1872142 RepID=UPI002CEC17BD|nr:sulfur carrier protein ThiS [Actinospica sp.]HWG22824.1 sulfur carrier protein ThiS [Actinospica sp.]
MNPITVTVNGEAQRIPADEPLSELITRRTNARSGVAVAVNGEVVPRTAWPAHVLEDGARIEILTAVQGG